MGVYQKLSIIRDEIGRKKEPDLMDAIKKICKKYEIVPLFSFYDGLANLDIVDFSDERLETINFKLKTDGSVEEIKREIYYMAFDINVKIDDKKISQAELDYLVKQMNIRGVKSKEICERYKVNDLEEMTKEKYERCIRVLERMGESNNVK